MLEAKFPGVQHLARKSLCESAAVNFITQDRMTEMMKMNADLMGAAAVKSAFHQTQLARGSDDAVFGLGRTTSPRRD